MRGRKCWRMSSRDKSPTLLTRKAWRNFCNISEPGPWVEILAVVRDGFNAENPRRPIALWQDISPELKHLVRGVNKLQP